MEHSLKISLLEMPIAVVNEHLKILKQPRCKTVAVAIVLELGGKFERNYFRVLTASQGCSSIDNPACERPFHFMRHSCAS